MNRLALLTGGSGGIGEALAYSLARNKVDIILNYRSQKDRAEKIKSNCEKEGVKVYLYQGDISDSDKVRELFAYIKEEFGSLDILINNAGITRDSLIIKMKDEDFEEVLQTNLTAAFYLMREASRLMIRARKGKIINISSIVGIRGNPGQVNYAASKAGLIAMTKSLAKELGRRSINVNTIAPGFIETEMTRVLPKEYIRKMEESIALGRLGRPEDIANMLEFLISNKADYITGQTLVVDGGLSI